MLLLYCNMCMNHPRTLLKCTFSGSGCGRVNPASLTSSQERPVVQSAFLHLSSKDQSPFFKHRDKRWPERPSVRRWPHSAVRHGIFPMPHESVMLLICSNENNNITTTTTSNMKADPQILVARISAHAPQTKGKIFGKPWEFRCKAHSHSHFLPPERERWEELADHSTDFPGTRVLGQVSWRNGTHMNAKI